MYFLRRLLYLPFSLFLLSLLCFALREAIPGDPVAERLVTADTRLQANAPAAYDARYARLAKQLGRDLPLFYFSVRNAALPDTLQRVVRPTERKMVRALTLDAGRWEVVSDYYRAIRQAAYAPETENFTADERRLARRLLNQENPERIATIFQEWEGGATPSQLRMAYERMMADRGKSQLLLPRFRWHGADNQYHRWLGRLLAGELGTSQLDGQPVSEKIGRALPWTLLLNLLTLLVVMGVAIPLGLYLAGKAGSATDRYATLLLFLLFGIPTFWVATLLANFFTTPAYGMDFFPSMGVGEVAAGASIWEILTVRASHFFLPVLCLAYPSLAYVTRHLRQSTLAELGKGYVNTARMTGLSERAIRWRHVFRNASFPLITIFGGLFPQLLAGSVIIERIFNLPGMGQLLYVSAVNGDWPVVIVLVLLNGVLTAVGLLAADLLYALVDPRVNLDRPSLTHPTPN